MVVILNEDSRYKINIKMGSNFNDLRWTGSKT